MVKNFCILQIVMELDLYWDIMSIDSEDPDGKYFNLVVEKRCYHLKDEAEDNLRSRLQSWNITKLVKNGERYEITITAPEATK